jgi:hypothetical protein
VPRGLRQALDALRVGSARQALTLEGGSIAGAARRLRCSPSYVYYLINTHPAVKRTRDAVLARAKRQRTAARRAAARGK